MTGIMQTVMDVACVALGVWLAYHASEGTFSEWCDRKYLECQVARGHSPNIDRPRDP